MRVRNENKAYNYNQYKLCLLFCIIQIISCINKLENNVNNNVERNLNKSEIENDLDFKITENEVRDQIISLKNLNFSTTLLKESGKLNN